MASIYAASLPLGNIIPYKSYLTVILSFHTKLAVVPAILVAYSETITVESILASYGYFSIS